MHFYNGSRPPIVKPIDSCGRGFYETGRPPSGSGPSFNTPGLPTTAFENISSISSQPCWLLFLHATFNQEWDQDGYILLFDLNASDQNQLQLVTAGAVARFTLGPVLASSGGTIIYESGAEMIPQINVGSGINPNFVPWASGLPFNFGIVAAASSTPRVLTSPVGPGGDPVSSVVARIQT